MNQECLLNSYKALDISDGKGFMCGRILADFGGDVIKLEPPGGDPSRWMGPFHQDVEDPEKSLYWFAYNANKRGITLDLEAGEGKRVFADLVEIADFVIESYPPGYLDRIGLGYSSLAEINPRIIMTSISPFGQNGPWRECQGEDIVLWGLSSYMYVTGDEDRPPVRPSFPQSYLHACLEAASASLVALHHRQRTGEGQWIDVSAQQALAVVSLQNQQYWNLARFNPRRGGAFQHLTGVRWTRQRRLWRCRDGFVAFVLFSGHLGASGNQALTDWMDREGLAPDCMKQIDWYTFDPQGSQLTDEDYHQLMNGLESFFLHHTKKELYEEAVRSRIVLYPCNNTADILSDAHLGARGFWKSLPHDELGTDIVYPRPPVRFSAAQCDLKTRAPLVGEHNETVYLGELGYTRETLDRLEREGIV